MQRTLAHEFRITGAGIHTGALATVTVWPADVDFGRRFRVGSHTFPARADYVLDTRRCTTLGTPEASVQTGEHLLSALFAYHIDNCLIEVEGPEIPILDGSALPHVQAIEQSGIIAQGKSADVLRLTDTIGLEERGSQLVASPLATTDLPDQFRIETTVEFAHWPAGNRSLVFADNFAFDSALGAEASATYRETIAPARTFAFRHEVEQLLAAGLARGGSLDNALIITPPDTFSSPLRLPDEWCAHKTLDILGDLSLVGVRLALSLSALRPGHGPNSRMAMALLDWWRGFKIAGGGEQAVV